jgi:cytochrome c oxidase cbb3-type subunit 4
MDTNYLLREFADSGMLLAMFTFFGVCVLWVMRPGTRRTYRDTAAIPFRNETKPAAGADAGKEV